MRFNLIVDNSYIDESLREIRVIVVQVYLYASRFVDVAMINGKLYSVVVSGAPTYRMCEKCALSTSELKCFATKRVKDVRWKSRINTICQMFKYRISYSAIGIYFEVFNPFRYNTSIVMAKYLAKYLSEFKDDKRKGDR